MTILFNNDSENLIHDYLNHTTTSTLPQAITQAGTSLGSGSLTAAALSRAAASWSGTVAQSNGATAVQLHSVASMLATLRAGDEGLAAQLGRIR